MNDNFTVHMIQRGENVVLTSRLTCSFLLKIVDVAGRRAHPNRGCLEQTNVAASHACCRTPWVRIVERSRNVKLTIKLPVVTLALNAKLLTVTNCIWNTELKPFTVRPQKSSEMIVAIDAARTRLFKLATVSWNLAPIQVRCAPKLERNACRVSRKVRAELFKV